MNEEAYIHSLLEPDEILITGNYKRHKELPGHIRQRQGIDNLRQTCTPDELKELMMNEEDKARLRDARNTANEKKLNL